MKKEIRYLQGVAIHTRYWSDDCDGGWAWVKVMSERHADRMASLLGWYSYKARGPGRPFADVWYNARRKRLTISFGWDV